MFRRLGFLDILESLDVLEGLDSLEELGFLGFRLLLVLRSFVEEVHKLVELRSDDDLGAAVALLAHLCRVGCYRVILATTTCCETLRVYTVLVLESLNHAGSTQS